MLEINGKEFIPDDDLVIRATNFRHAISSNRRLSAIRFRITT